jgi:hypothetical protein
VPKDLACAVSGTIRMPWIVGRSALFFLFVVSFETQGTVREPPRSHCRGMGKRKKEKKKPQEENLRLPVDLSIHS